MSPSSNPAARVDLPATIGWAGPWVALAALAVWTSSASPIALVVAACGLAAAVAFGPPSRGPAWGIGNALLVVAVLAGFFAQRQVDHVLNDWDRYWDDRHEELRVDLNDELDRRLAAGESASDALAALATQSSSQISADDVSAVRERYQPSALAF